jgi:hypothetical protein
MNKTMTPRLVGLLLIAAFWANVARADPGGTPARPFGLGGIVGHPSGASAKFFFDGLHAVDLAVGLGFVGGRAFHVHSDYLFHALLHRARKFYVLVFFGGGVTFNLWSDDKGKFLGGKKTGRAGLGIRAPIGVAFHILKVPLDPFGEIAPGLGLLPGPSFAIDASAGVRYYF